MSVVISPHIAVTTALLICQLNCYLWNSGGSEGTSSRMS